MDWEDAHEARGVFGALNSNPAMSIIGAEDEDFENDLNEVPDSQCPHFNCIEKLKARPTHLLVFLHHVILQFDCAALLCYLHADLFKNLSAKETKKQFVEFHNNFLDKGAILKVVVPAAVSNELDRTRPELLTEDLQRRYVQEVQSQQEAEVAKQLEDFRCKRMMGMTANETELVDVENHYPTDRIPMEMKEKSVAEVMLDKMAENQANIVADEDRCQAIFASVAVYLKHLGVKSRAVDSKKSRGGFFRRPLGKNKKDESTKTKPRGGFPSIPSWIAGSTDKDKPAAQERKNSQFLPPRGDPLPLPFPSRKSCSVGGGSSSSQPALEISECSGLSSSTASSPDGHSEGLPSNRLEPPPSSDGGDVSPISLGGLSTGEPFSPCETTTEENMEKERQKTRKVARSESARVDRHSSRRRGSSRGKQSRSRSDVDLQPPNMSASPLSLTPQHPSAHHLMDGPPQFPDGTTPPSPSPQPEEMEPRLVELEQDPANWRELADRNALANLSKKETKRQEVINELYTTEHAHYRMLTVLQTVFSKPLEREEILTGPELATIFPSLEEILEMHYTFHENLKALREEDEFIVKNIGATLLNRFGGPEGEWFQKLTARFCSHQSWALEQIKSRQKKDARFNAFILEAESKPQCRRLQLKDIIPTEMQRLTKYPLLLENIAKSTEDQEEKDKILQSAECCRKILNHVNDEVKYMENLLNLKDYQRRLDTSGLKPSTDLYTEYKNIDLTLKNMIYEGPLTWKVTKEKAIEVQCVLLGDLLVLLQRQDDKMVLKCQSKSNVAVQEGKQMLSPIIKLNSVFLREVATDRKAFYVIFTWDSGAQIYELVAQSSGERNTWTEAIKKAVDDLKQSGPAVGGPLSPVGGRPPHLVPLSPTLNGNFKSSIVQDNDSLTEDKSPYPQHSVMYYLSEKGFDLFATPTSEQDKVAQNALDDVTGLKRLLVSSISLSEDSMPEEENGKDDGGSEKLEDCTDGSKSPEDGGPIAGASQVEDGPGGAGSGGAKGVEEGGISAPLVLSKERVEEVYSRLQGLEENLRRLQTMEEAHHKLLMALSMFSLEGGNFQ
ncbi:rho guanine nucleotide exchange factor 1 isoform X3 [Gadus morhua]|uniref:rho guanine nucleotide exchange factor 1 isoform X3 n=1 Tax=Gadus morhua TaxID=8049 RepID=UPI0011B72337|nr:rho guanine nucleotide exchange factor 1 isoform X3 [Gadus morhua]